MRLNLLVVDNITSNLFNGDKDPGGLMKVLSCVIQVCKETEIRLQRMLTVTKENLPCYSNCSSERSVRKGVPSLLK